MASNGGDAHTMFKNSSRTFSNNPFLLFQICHVVCHNKLNDILFKLVLSALKYSKDLVTITSGFKETFYDIFDVHLEFGIVWWSCRSKDLIRDLVQVGLLCYECCIVVFQLFPCGPLRSFFGQCCLNDGSRIYFLFFNLN